MFSLLALLSACGRCPPGYTCEPVCPEGMRCVPDTGEAPHSESADSGGHSDPSLDSSADSETPEDTSPSHPLDQDNDGDGWTPRQGDCLDSNAAVHPLQAAFFTSHRGDGSYDYDCNGVEEVAYRAWGSCKPNAAHTACVPTVISQGYGDVVWYNGNSFYTPPACGVPGRVLTTCTRVTPTYCEDAEEARAIQACH